mmetsp:Transcript_45930/g.91028  ORF Transcript_45930/g.91028 Transcript_45930/m.91028 type:complete len:350 (-) Transcript_45930:648-1697(-)
MAIAGRPLPIARAPNGRPVGEEARRGSPHFVGTPRLSCCCHCPRPRRHSFGPRPPALASAGQEEKGGSLARSEILTRRAWSAASPLTRRPQKPLPAADGHDPAHESGDAILDAAHILHAPKSIQAGSLQHHLGLLAVRIEDDLEPPACMGDRLREAAEVVRDHLGVQDVLPVVSLAAGELPPQTPLDDVGRAGVHADNVHAVSGAMEHADDFKCALALLGSPREHDDVPLARARPLEDLRLGLAPVRLDGRPCCEPDSAVGVTVLNESRVLRVEAADDHAVPHDRAVGVHAELPRHRVDHAGLPRARGSDEHQGGRGGGGAVARNTGGAHHGLLLLASQRPQQLPREVQ